MSERGFRFLAITTITLGQINPKLAYILGTSILFALTHVFYSNLDVIYYCTVVQCWKYQ